MVKQQNNNSDYKQFVVKFVDKLNQPSNKQLNNQIKKETVARKVK